MPVKIWKTDDHGRYTSSIITSWRTELVSEEYRVEAEALDMQIDSVLDRAVELSAAVPDGQGKSQEFVKRWAIGRAIRESGVLDSPQMASEQRKNLWLAMARKCRLGVRASGKLEERWRTLIPDRELEPQRLERDVFARGLWLQEQDCANALATFNGSLALARQLYSRESLRSANLRNALRRWFQELDPLQRSRLFRREQFIAIVKTLQKRWPSRGPGSAKRPAHFSDQDLDREVHRVLAPFIYIE